MNLFESALRWMYAYVDGAEKTQSTGEPENTIQIGLPIGVLEKREVTRWEFLLRQAELVAGDRALSRLRSTDRESEAAKDETRILVAADCEVFTRLSRAIPELKAVMKTLSRDQRRSLQRSILDLFFAGVNLGVAESWNFGSLEAWIENQAASAKWSENAQRTNDLKRAKAERLAKDFLRFSRRVSESAAAEIAARREVRRGDRRTQRSIQAVRDAVRLHLSQRTR